MVSRLSSLTRHLVVGYHHNVHRHGQFRRGGMIAFQNALITCPSTTLQPQRSYHINLAKETSDDDDDGINNNIHQTKSANNLNDIDSDTLQSYNLLTRRLYRTLLKSAKIGVGTANEGNVIDCNSSIGGSSTDTSLKKDWILLQPPIDQRKYGFAKIVAARRGHTSLSSLLKDDMSNFNCSNKAVKSMNKEEVGISMEILKFIHVQLGGSRYDDLEEYYLGSSLIPDEMDVTKILGKGQYQGASAGKHSDGHYTQFIDDDPERGEGGEEVGDGTKPDNLTIIEAEEDTDDEDEDENEEDYPEVDEWDSDDESDNNEQLELDESILVTSQDLQNAIKIAFRAPLLSQSSSSSTEEKQTTSTIISRRHRDAINACSELSQQLQLWGDKSSIYTDYEHGVRVAVSSCLMMRQGVSKQNRFAYRVRVENIVDVIDEMKKENEGNSGSSSKDAGIEDEKSSDGIENRAVQLLGRSWTILERGPFHKTSTSVLQRLLEEGVITNNGDNVESADDEDINEDEFRVVQTVTEPRTGAVGHLPVLGPGEVFEYMSGADISTPTGAMEGTFHFAKVNMQTTDSAHIGDDVDALTWKSDDERLFDIPVARFGFVADDDIET